MDMQRVKVYRLNDEGTWDDKGTGHVGVEFLEQCDSLGLIVIGEADRRALLIHRIRKDTAYQQQGDNTIITWSDPDMGTDIALSFEEPYGCGQIWKRIIDIQRGNATSPRSPRLADGSPAGEGSPDDSSSPKASTISPSAHNNNRNTMMRNSPPSNHIIDEFDHVGIGLGRFDEFIPGSGPGSGSLAPAELPSPTFESLQAIAKAVNEVSLFQRDAMVLQLMRTGYLEALIECFHRAEDLEDEESLYALYHIFKAAVLLNDTNLFEMLFSDELILDVVGALEFEPGVKPEDRPQHRTFLQEQSQFKEPVPFNDPAVKSKIQQTHRMGYIKDVVLPRVLDDGAFATLSSLMLFNNVEVLMALHQDPKFFPELFIRLKEADPGSEAWKNLVAFLQELCGLLRHLQASQRNAILSKLIDLGLFDVLTSVLKSGEDESRLRAADILLADVVHDPSPLRRYLQQPSNDLFNQLIQAQLTSSDSGIQEQAWDILTKLIDPDTMEVTAEKDSFTDMFYDHHIGTLMAALVHAADHPEDPAAISPGTLVMICDLLSLCVYHHGYRIKYYILRQNAVEKVLRLLKRKEKWVVAAAVRFLKQCLTMKDDFYNRYLVKNSLLEPVIVAFIANREQYNMVNSALLDLFNFIRKENMKGLMASIVASPHWPQLEAVTYCDTFKALLLKHEQNQEGRHAGSMALPMLTSAGAAAAGGASRGANAINSNTGPRGGGVEAQQAQHEQEQRIKEAEAAAQRAAAAETAMKLRGEQQEDADEESYFSKDNEKDEEESGQGGATIGTAVAGIAGLEASRMMELPPLRVPPLPKRKHDDDEDDDDLAAFTTRKRERPANGRVVLQVFAPGPSSLAAMPAATGFLPKLVDYDDDDDDIEERKNQDRKEATEEPQEGAPIQQQKPENTGNATFTTTSTPLVGVALGSIAPAAGGGGFVLKPEAKGNGNEISQDAPQAAGQPQEPQKRKQEVGEGFRMVLGNSSAAGEEKKS